MKFPLMTEDIDDDTFSIHILEIQMMIFQYPHTEDVDDDVTDDDSVFTHWCKKVDDYGLYDDGTDEASASSRVQTLSRQAWCGSKRSSPKGGVVMLQ